MKKRRFKTSVIILVLLVTNSYMNNGTAQSASFGSSFGMNFAKWRGDVDLFANNLNFAMEEIGIYGMNFEPITRKGIQFGLYYDGPLKNKIRLRVELNYSQKGTKFKHDGVVTIYDGWDEYVFNVEQKIVEQMNYLELPILLRYNFLKNNSGITPYILLGPTVGWLMTSKIKIVTDVDGDSDTETEKESGYKKFDVGIYAGAGIAFTENLLLEFRYNYNFISLLDTDISDPYIFYNNMFSVVLFLNWLAE